MWKITLTSLFYLILMTNCSEKEFNPEQPHESFIIAKEPYDDGNYDIALTKLGEFKSRFPYSQYATEAELLIANSHFKLLHYAEATASFKQFIKLHPKHPKVPYAHFKMGESYWADAPEEVDREQHLTSKAIDEWQVLLESYPQSPDAAKAKTLIEQGRRRIAESEMFIASFYCKKEIWHACAYRYVNLADKAPTKFKDLTRKALLEASFAFEKLASGLNKENADKNLYFRKMSKTELLKQAKALKQKANEL